MAKETKKGSAQLNIGSPEWTAAREREAAEEQRREEAKRRAAAEAQRARLQDIARVARGDRDDVEAEERGRFM